MALLRRLAARSEGLATIEYVIGAAVVIAVLLVIIAIMALHSG